MEAEGISNAANEEKSGKNSIVELELYSKLSSMPEITASADVEMLYIQRSEGGKGQLQLESFYKTITIGLQTY